MVELIVNGGRDRLKLLPDTRIRLRRQNSMFFLGDVLPADFTLPFELPTAGNAKLMDWQHLPEAGRYPVMKDVVMSLDGGNATFRGQLQLLSSTRDRYRVNLVLKDDALKADTSIRDLVSGVVNMHEDFGEDTAEDINARTWPDARYCMPSYINDHPDFQKYFLNYSFFSENVAYAVDDLVLYNDRVYKCINPHFGGWDAANFVSTYAYVNRVVDGVYYTGAHPGAVLGAKYPMAMFMYLCQVLRDVIAGTGYEARGDVFDNAWMRKVIVWNNYILSWDGGTGIATEYRNLLPDMTLREFLRSIRDFYGVRIAVDDTNRIVWFDVAQQAIYKYTTTNWDDKVLRPYELVFDALRGMELRQSFEHDQYPGEVIGKVRHNERDAASDTNSRLSTPDTAPFGALDGKFVYERYSNAYLFFDDDASVRETRGYKFDEYVTGNGELKIDPAAGTIPMFLDVESPDTNTPPGTLQLLPRVKHLWSDTLTRNPFGLRFLYFHGAAKQIDGIHNYPYATSLGVVPIGPSNYIEEGEGDMSPEGMYNRFYKYFDAWLQQSKMYEADVVLSARNAAISEREVLRFNGMNYMWRELEIEFDGNGSKVRGEGVFVRV